MVAAFDAILAKDLDTDGAPAGAANRLALPVAGDDRSAVAQVMRLVYQLGFDLADAGCMAESWPSKQAKPFYCIALDAEQLVRALSG